MLQFEFDGHNSSEYGIIMTGITDNDNLESRSLQLGEKNRYRARENHFGTVYDDNYSFTLSIMKNPCTISNSVPSLRNGVLVYEEKYLPTLTNNTLIFPMGSTPSVDHGTLQMNDTYYLSHDADTSSTTITKMQGKSITLYFIQQDGEYTTDRYITEKWINEQNFANADSVKEYVSNIIEETVLNVLDDHIDAALERKLGGIDSKDLTNIFQGGN